MNERVYSIYIIGPNEMIVFVFFAHRLDIGLIKNCGCPDMPDDIAFI